MDRGAWQATIHVVTKAWDISNLAHAHIHTCVCIYIYTHTYAHRFIRVHLYIKLYMVVVYILGSLDMCVLVKPSQLRL